jgi:hypothetical protein
MPWDLLVLLLSSIFQRSPIGYNNETRIPLLPLCEAAGDVHGLTAAFFKGSSGESLLVLLMTVLSQTFFTFVSGYLMTFSFFTARHNL